MDDFEKDKNNYDKHELSGYYVDTVLVHEADNEGENK